MKDIGKNLAAATFLCHDRRRRIKANKLISKRGKKRRNQNGHRVS